jgi:hypothetical protein
MRANKAGTILGAAAALVVAAALLHQFTVEAAPARNSDPRRGYYVTKTKHTGSGALTACAAGYHMASIYELVNPPVLRYETTLGVADANSGSGPPSGGDGVGWARTGGPEYRGHCSVWTSDDATHFGTQAYFTLAGVEQVPSLRVFTPYCSSQAGVWCIQD